MSHATIDQTPARWGREGFALPAAIFAILVVAILVTAGFLFSSQEVRIGQASDRTVEARLLAEDGLNTVMAGTFNEAQMQAFADLQIWGDPMVIPGDPQGDGSWTVEVRRVAERNYRLQSMGRITEGGRLAGAERTLGSIVRNTATTTQVDFTQIEDDAALKTQGPVVTKGNAQIIGYDEPLSAWGGFGSEVCPGEAQDRAGVINTEGDAVDNQGASQIEGDPRDVQVPYEHPDDFMTFGDGTDSFGWDEMVLAATHSLPGGTFPGVGPRYNESGVCDTSQPLNWGEPQRDPDAEVGGAYQYPSTHCFHYFPIIHIDGNAQVGGGGAAGGRGQGILLVDGNLNINGGFEFYGTILVRGQVETQGNGNRVMGSIRATGSAELESSDYAGGSILRYSSCAVSRSQNNAFQPPTQVFLVPVGSRSWMDLTAAGH